MIQVIDLAQQPADRMLRAYRLLADVNHMLLRMTDETALFQSACQLVVGTGGYRFAWVGIAEHDAARSVRPVASSGIGSEYLNGLNITWANTSNGQGPVGTAIRTGEPVFSTNTATDPHFAPWRTAALRHGFAAVIALPLCVDDRVLGALTIYNDTPNVFDDEEVSLLSELADNLAFGITTVRLREERHNDREALRESEERYRLLFQSSGDAIFVVEGAHDELPGRIIDVNDIACQMLGYTRDELLQMHISHLDAPDPMAQASKMLRRLYTRKDTMWEAVMLTKDERLLSVEIHKTLFTLHGREVIMATARDITARKRAERTLLESEEKFFKTFALSPDAMSITRLSDGVYLDINRGFTALTGYTIADMLGRSTRANDFDILANVADRERLMEGMREHGEVLEMEAPFRCKDGGIRIGMLSARIIEINGEACMLSITRDITERKRVEEALRRSEAAFKTLFDESPVPTLLSELSTGKIAFANQRVYDTLGRTPEEVIGKDTADLGLIFKPDDQERLTNEILNHGSVDDLEVKYIHANGASSVILVSMRIVSLQDTPYCLSVLQDITERKRAQSELSASHEREEKALRSTIQAIAMTLETKDPYTAGHQRRVADLACVIAREMGIPEDCINGLQMAGIIHDIGKVAIPSEILSTPRPLSTLEFQLIKNHAIEGYEILKDIEFPWPVAQIILQHHERIDGGGYPQGLAGDQLLIESKILAVADVVEAMASHRPYRPSLGLQAALEEITAKRGIAYDAQVVDVCVRVIEEGYQFRTS